MLQIVGRCTTCLLPEPCSVAPQMVSSLSVWHLDAGPVCPYSPRTWADGGGAFDRVLLHECLVSPRIVSRQEKKHYIRNLLFELL